jgi:hypothetical protein
VPAAEWANAAYSVQNRKRRRALRTVFVKRREAAPKWCISGRRAVGNADGGKDYF